MPKKPTEPHPRLRNLVLRMRNKRIGVVGDLMLDRYLWGTPTRLSPEAPVPIVAFVEQSECLGGAGNVAANLAALGAKVELFSAIGPEKEPRKQTHDGAAASLRMRLAAEGIGHRGVFSDSKRITTVKTRIIARHHHIVRVDRERNEPLQAETEGRLLRAISAAIETFDALVLSDYDKGILSEEFSEKILTAAHRAKVPVFINPKNSRLYAYRGAKAIVCNQKEAGDFMNLSLTDEKVGEAGRALLARFGCAAVLITQGSRGMTLVEENSPREIHIPATGFEVTYARLGQPGVERGATGRQVFDVTGAGDTVLSVLALAVAGGASLPDAAVLANIAAGVVVSKLGTATLTPQELLHALAEARP
jgi:rfaE bifunctional protein kinase chain/domain